MPTAGLHSPPGRCSRDSCLPSHGSCSSSGWVPSPGSIARPGTSDSSVREQAPPWRCPRTGRARTWPGCRPPARPYTAAPTVEFACWYSCGCYFPLRMEAKPPFVVCSRHTLVTAETNVRQRNGRYIRLPAACLSLCKIVGPAGTIPSAHKILFASKVGHEVAHRVLFNAFSICGPGWLAVAPCPAAKTTSVCRLALVAGVN